MIIDKASEIKERIVNLLRMRGPSLPIPLAKVVGQTSIFTSAFLSELVGDQKIKISHMRVGASPIYYLPGQELDIDRFSVYLNSKEREALALLKEKRFLKDSQQHPAIRVALRSIKDFAMAFKKGEEIYWRHISVPEGEFEIKEPEIKKEEKVFAEIKPEAEKKSIEEEIETKEEVKKDKEEKKNNLEIREIKKKRKKAEKKEFELNIFEKEEKPEKIIEKSDFVKKVEEFLERHNFKIIKGIEIKKKDYRALVETEGKLGKTGFLCIAKDKKSISESDLTAGLQKSSVEKSPLLFLSPGEMSRGGKKFAEDWQNLVKFMKLD